MPDAGLGGTGSLQNSGPSVKRDEPEIDESLFEPVVPQPQTSANGSVTDGAGVPSHVEEPENGASPAAASAPLDAPVVDDGWTEASPSGEAALASDDAAPAAPPEAPAPEESDEPTPDPAELRELARRLEAMIASSPEADPATDALRSRLVTLYQDELDDAERAFVHLEPLLTRDAVDDPMLDAAERLLMQRAIAPRLAPLLAEAYARLGRYEEEAGPLTLELSFAKPPRLGQVQRRLALLRQEVLDDADGALELLEQILTAEPTDEDVRGRFIELSSLLRRGPEAAAVLTRLASQVGDAALAARLHLEVGRLLFVAGEQDQARIAFEHALAADTQDEAVLLAARELCAFAGGPGNVAVQALSILATREPEPEARHRAAQALLDTAARQRLAPEIEILAWRALLESPRELEALARLETVCEAAGEDAILADVLARRAELASDPAAAARFAFRSTELLAKAAPDDEARVDVWHAFFARYATSPAERAALFEREDLSETARFALRRSVLREAEMARTPAARITLLSEAAAYIDEAQEDDEQALEIAMMGLLHAAMHDPSRLHEWLARVFRHSARMDPLPRAEMFARAIAGIDDEPAHLPLLLAVARAFADAEAHARALDVYGRALALDPSSPDILAAIDALQSRAGEPPQKRVERYNAALARVEDPERRADLACAIGRLEREASGELAPAIARYRGVIVERPSHVGAHAALLEAYAEQGAEAELDAELERARGVIEPSRRSAAALSAAQSLIARGCDAPGLDLARRVLSDPALDASALDAVFALAEERDDLGLLRAVFEARVRLSAEGPTRVHAYERLGEFLAERIGDNAAAAEAWKAAAKEAELGSDRCAESRRLYERALESAGDDPEAAVALIRSYAQAGDWSELAGVFNVLLRKAEEPERLALCLELLLSLADGAKKSRAGAEFAALADELLWRLGSDAAADNRALMLAKATVLAADPTRFDPAAEAYRALIEAHGHPDDVAAFRGFIEAQSDTELRREELSWLFEWRAGKAENPTPILIEWARVEETRFSDPGSAAAICERALARDPESLEALEYLAQLRLSAGDWDGREECLAKLAARYEGARRVDIELERATLSIEKLDRAADALPLLEYVLAETPESTRARELTRALCRSRDPDTRAKAARLLVKASADDAPAVLARALDEALSATAEIDPLPEEEVQALEQERRAWYERAIALAPDPRAAFDLAERAALESPGSEPLWAAMSERAVALGQPALAVGVYQKAFERAKDRDEIDELGRRLLTFADSQSVDVGVTTTALLALLAVAPAARWALDRVKLLLHARGQYDVLFELYDRAIDATDDESARAELLNEASVAAKDLAADVDRAIGYLERLHELRNDDVRVDTLLERLYERHNRTAKLIEHLERRLPRLTEGELAALRERIVSLRLDLGAVDDVLPMIGAMLAADPESEAPIALLERLFTLPAARAGSETEPCVAEAAAELLCDRYFQTGRPREVVRVTGETLSFVAAPDRRAALLERLAAVNENEIGDLGAALSAVGELVLLDPSDEARRARLGTLAERLGAHDRQLDFLLRAAEQAEGLALKAGLLREAARLCEGPLGNPERAAQLYEQLLENATDDRELTLATLHALSSLWLALARPEKRCDVLERLATLENEDGRRRALTEAAETAATALGDPERAARSWQALVDEDARDLRALDGLIAALSACGRFPDLARALELRIQSGEGAAVVRDKKALARLFAERLGNGEAAIAIWRELRAADPDDAETLDALAALLESERRFPELIELFESAIAASSAPQALYQRLARVHRVHTGDTRAAVVALLAAGDLSAATELAQSSPPLDDPPLRVELATALIDAGQADDAVRVLRTQIEQYADRRPKERAGVHVLLARALLLADRAPIALFEMKEAAAIDPSNPDVLQKLGDLAFEQGDFDVADQTYRALLLVALHPGDGQGQPPRRAEIYYRLSEIAERRWETDRAQELLASAMDTALESDAEAEGLERALCRGGKDELLLEVLEQRQKQAESPAAAAQALCAVLELRAASGPLSEPLAARIRERAAELRAELAKSKSKRLGLEAWKPLLEIQRRLGGPDGVLELLGYLSKRFAKTEAGPELLLEAGRLMLEIPERRAEAIENLEQALASDPGRTEVARLLAGAYEAQNRLEEALAAYERLAAQPGDGRKEALEAVARLLEATQAGSERRERTLEELLALEQGARAGEIAEQLYRLRRERGDAAGALAALSAGLEADPGRRGLALLFADACAESGESERALGVLGQALASSPSDVELERRLAAALEAAGRPTEALEALDRLHEQDALDAAALLAAIERTGLGSAQRWAMREVSLLIESGERERARQRLGAWLETHAEDGDALRELARLASAERAWPEAIDAYERLLRSPGAVTAEVVLEFAEACERAGQLERAVAELERAGRTFPRHAGLRKLLRRIYTDGKQHEKLARLLVEDAEAESAPAAKADLLERAGQSLLEVNLPEQALSPLEQARSLAPERTSIAIAYARALAGLGKTEEAVQCLSELLKAHKGGRDPELMRVYEEIARIHLAADELVEAYEILLQAHRLDRSNLRIAYLLGLVAYDVDELTIAGNALRIVIVASRGEGGLTGAERATAYYYLGFMQYIKGSDASARQMAARAVEEDPSNDEAKKLLELVEAHLRG